MTACASTADALVLLKVGYFHGFLNGVDYVFVDHPAYHHVAGDIYAGSRTDILFRCALLCKVGALGSPRNNA